MVKVSVIATVRNEAGPIRHLLDSLLSQRRSPDEVIIVDGGSTDATVDVLDEYARHSGLPLRVMVEPGCNIAEGRNRAIAAASSEVIASTDAGVRFDETWLQHLVAPFEQSDRAPDVACGFFVPDPLSVFEVAMGATVLPKVEEIDPERFFPSSRSAAFRRSAWEAVGGYPEWMSFSEDLLFDMALKAAGFRFVFVPEAVVWFRPRSSLGAFWRQYRNYAMGDGEGLLWTGRHLIRYATYLVLTPGLGLMGAFWSPGWWGLVGLGLAVYLRRPYERLAGMVSGLTPRERLKAALWVPVIRVWGDLAKMVGYPIGLPRGIRQRGRTRAYLRR